jgi:integrase
VATIINKQARNPRKPWAVRYQDAGRQRERSFATKREAQDFKIMFEHDSRAQVFIDPRDGSTPFVEYAAGWIERMDATPGTKAGYRGHLRNHIAPWAGTRTLAQVAQDRDGLADMLAAMRRNGASASATGTCRSVITGAMDAAVAAGKISSHRLGGLKVTRPAPAPATITPATTAQLAALADGLRELGLTVWLMRGAGLRVSEALAVRVGAFRDAGRVLRISEQATRDGAGTAALKKRRANEFRDVPVAPWLWARVQAHVARYGTSPDGYLFSTGSHRPSYTVYRARFVRAAEAAGLAAMTIHNLRHQFASTLLGAGVPLTDVSAWLGHRDVNITAQVYGHLLADSWGRARAALDSIAE